MMNDQKRIFRGIMAVMLFSVTVMILINFVMPIAKKIMLDLSAYETRTAHRDNYQLHTTPLSKEVVSDICSKLNIQETSENCKPSTIVYSPDLFDEIKTYFNSLPDQAKTYTTVQDLLGEYLISCEDTTSSGHYRCRYDIRGDRVYPIAFYFNEKDYYFQIIATTEGS